MLTTNLNPLPSVHLLYATTRKYTGNARHPTVSDEDLGLTENSDNAQNVVECLPTEDLSRPEWVSDCTPVYSSPVVRRMQWRATNRCRARLEDICVEEPELSFIIL